MGIALLERAADRLGSGDLALVEELVRRSRSWAYVDWLATKVAGALVRRDRSLLRTLRRWGRDDDFWLRRAALLALLDDLRAGAGEWTLFVSLATPLLTDREPFIRKAIGWVLRDTARRRPALVAGYLDANLARLSGLTLREAVRHLPAARRTSLLARWTALGARARGAGRQAK